MTKKIRELVLPQRRAKVGWLERVAKTAAAGMLDQNARYTFDRLLGANLETPKESPPQRPMGAGGLVKDLEARHLDLNHVDVGDGAWTSVFRFVTRAARGGRLDVDRLAPSIAQVRVDTANNQLIVMGELEPYYVPDSPSPFRWIAVASPMPATSTPASLRLCCRPPSLRTGPSRPGIPRRWTCRSSELAT